MPSSRRLVSAAALVLTFAGTVGSAAAAGVATGGGAAAAMTASATERIDGPDVASYQHPYGARIDWHKVARAGHEFAIVKATEGTSYRNPWFGRDYTGSRKAGLVRGSYHFARPAYPVVRTAKRQARYYVARLGSSATTSRTLPPALDLELTGGLGRGALVTWAQTFLLATRQLTGRTPMIYTYPSFWTSAMGDPAALARYPLWMAAYGTPVDPSATLWQYTARASVQGIHGSVDMSRLMASPETWSALSDGRTPDSWPAAAPGPAQSVHVAGGDHALSVSWLPGDTGSGPISRYVVTASPGNHTKTVSAVQFSAQFANLDNGTPYTVSIAAVNGHGSGEASDPVVQTPLVPVTMTVDAPPTAYGDDARARVRLTRDNGRAAAGQQVQVEQRDPATGDWTVTQTITTGDTGWAGVTVPKPEHSTDVRFTFLAPHGWQEVRRTVPVVVTNGVTAGLSRHHVHSGNPVTVTGHVVPRSGGVTVRMQVFDGSRWRVVHQVRTTADGSYSAAWTPRPTRRVTRPIRVVVAGFDHRASGISPTRHLLVRR